MPQFIVDLRTSGHAVWSLIALFGIWHDHAQGTQVGPMEKRSSNAIDAPAPSGGYSQAIELKNARRLLYISGQIPVDRDGNVPSDFAAQCRLAWANVTAQLRAANMSLGNLVKVTGFLADRRHALENSRIRREVLGEHAPALTVVISGIYDESWLLEIEAIAAE